MMTHGTMLKKIFETVFVNKSVELGIIDPHDKIIFDGCKVIIPPLSKLAEQLIEALLRPKYIQLCFLD